MFAKKASFLPQVMAPFGDSFEQLCSKEKLHGMSSPIEELFRECHKNLHNSFEELVNDHNCKEFLIVLKQHFDTILRSKMQSEMLNIVSMIRAQQNAYSGVPSNALSAFLSPKYQTTISQARGSGFMSRIFGLWAKWFKNPMRALSTKQPAPDATVSLDTMFENSKDETVAALMNFFQKQLKQALLKLIHNVSKEVQLMYSGLWEPSQKMLEARGQLSPGLESMVEEMPKAVAGKEQSAEQQKAAAERAAAAQKAAAERAAAEALTSTWDEQRPYFYFVHRDTILSCQTTSLPCMQQLRDSDQLVEERIDIESAFRGGGLIVKVLFVSHRWEAPGAPDGQGAQLKEVQRHLEENPGVELVWFDFWCMPQGERTFVEEKMFRLMLSAIADLYLTARVLILLDNSYSSRFWTLFEAWSSMMTATADGVRTAEPSERRFTIRCIHNANPKYAIPQLLDLLSSKTPQEIHATLAKPDVVVTNARDKDAMLPVVHSTNERVKTIFANMHQQSPELGCIADSSLAALAAEALRIAVATPIDAVLDEEDDL
jgi:hypothetical protein